MRRELRQLGLKAPDHSAPRQLAHDMEARFGAAGTAIAELLRHLDQQRYGSAPAARPSRAWMRQLSRQARQLRRQII
jgi:hypothetical protein